MAERHLRSDKLYERQYAVSFTFWALEDALGRVEADYADIRYERMKKLRISFSGREMTEMSPSESDGFVLKVFKNGGFSMGIAPALVVKGGEIKGRAGGLMISGNLYEVMKDVTAVENELHPTFGAISLRSF
jgi:predicted Zn-dependent protease